MKNFDASLRESDLFPLRATGVETCQINFGRLCNQACTHCHVQAGPAREETIGRETLDECLGMLARTDVATVDITGGAPELNPHFRGFVDECRALGKHVMVRCNLTVLLEPGSEELAQFYADRRVEIVASMPCYLEENVDAQRGAGVHTKSIEVLRLLNSVGFGRVGTNLALNLVYNPAGDALPPLQSGLETDYRRELADRYGIAFSNLLTITNMPIGRFRDRLEESGTYEPYVRKLIEAYNPAAVPGLMCHDTLSVGWDGGLYDCDFNLTLGMKCDHGAPEHIRDFDLERLRNRRVVTGLHCYGCTAGAGSSCGGAVLDDAQDAMEAPAQ